MMVRAISNADWEVTPCVVYYESIKRKIKTKYIWGVGVMKDYNLTLRNLHTFGKDGGLRDVEIQTSICLENSFKFRQDLKGYR